MSDHTVQVRELAAWGLDSYEHRSIAADSPRVLSASKSLATRRKLHAKPALVVHGNIDLKKCLAVQATREDLQTEMAGLRWTLGVVDLRCLVAFQRRLSLRVTDKAMKVPAQDDWKTLIDICFGKGSVTAEEVSYDSGNKSIHLRTTNPNLRVEFTKNVLSPIKISSGSPFFEVAQYRGRWFLRDGYHRAYGLLQAGIVEVPTVIIEAKSLAELGAIQPWFFAEDILFSDHPPMVTDFLRDELTIRYSRPALVKSIRITMDETFVPA